MKMLLKEKQQQKSKKLILGASICSIIFIVYMVSFSGSIPSQFLNVVESKVLTEPVFVKGSGVITTENISFVSAPYAGVVQTVDVKEGQLVKKGQSIIKIKNNELELELVESKFSRDDLVAEAKLKSSELQQAKLNKESTIERLDAIRELKFFEMEAIKELESQGIISKLDKRKAELELSLAKLELKSKKRNLSLFLNSYTSQIESLNERTEVRGNKIKFLTELINSLEIEANTSGLIKHIGIKKGQVVNHGQKLFELINPNNMMAKISIPQYSASAVIKGQAATVITPNGSLKGKVSSVDNVVRSGAIGVSILFEEGIPAWLRLEQSIEAVIETSTVIKKHIVQKPSEYHNYKEWSVYRFNRDNIATKAEYSLLNRDDGYLEVLGQKDKRELLILVPKQFSTSLKVEL